MKFFGFLELSDNIENYDKIPVCLFNGIWYTYVEKANEIEVFDYNRKDIPILPRHIRSLIDDDVPREIFFERSWFFVPQEEILMKDCRKVAEFLDKKYYKEVSNFSQ